MSEDKTATDRKPTSRRVLAAEDWTEAELEALKSMRVPDEYAALDAELAGWEPPAE